MTLKDIYKYSMEEDVLDLGTDLVDHKHDTDSASDKLVLECDYVMFGFIDHRKAFVNANLLS